MFWSTVERAIRRGSGHSHYYPKREFTRFFLFFVVLYWSLHVEWKLRALALLFFLHKNRSCLFSHTQAELQFSAPWPCLPVPWACKIASGCIIFLFSGRQRLLSRNTRWGFVTADSDFKYCWNRARPCLECTVLAGKSFRLLSMQ